MKASDVFKFVALAGVGAYAVSKVRENPALFGRVITSRERAHALIDHLGSAYNISPVYTEIVKDHAAKIYEPPSRRQVQGEIIDVTPRKSS